MKFSCKEYGQAEPCWQRSVCMQQAYDGDADILDLPLSFVTNKLETVLLEDETDTIDVGDRRAGCDDNIAQCNMTYVEPGLFELFADDADAPVAYHVAD